MPPVRSSSSVKLISLNRNKLLDALRDSAQRARDEHPEVVEVHLFGSLARGDYTGTSDADVLMILNHTPETDPIRRVLTFMPYFDVPCGVDLLVYTSAELENALAHNPFIQRAWAESQPLLP